MSQAQHIAEAQWCDHVLKIMEAFLRAIRSFRRMPPELEPHKSIRDCLDKFNAWEARFSELQQTIDTERAKPAHELPGIISPIRQGRSIDEALARMAADKAALGAPNPSSANPAQDQTPADYPWNNSQNDPPALPAPSAQQQTLADTPWNNSQSKRADTESGSDSFRTVDLWNSGTHPTQTTIGLNL